MAPQVKALATIVRSLGPTWWKQSTILLPSYLHTGSGMHPHKHTILFYSFKDCTSFLGTYWQKQSWWHPEWWILMTKVRKTGVYKSSQSKSDFIQARTYLAYLKLVLDRPVPSRQVLVTEVNHWRENQCYSGQLWQLWLKTAMVRSSWIHD